MEINNENKAKFFSQYYGQKILCIRSEEQPVLYVGFDDLQNDKVRDSDYLLLKQLSSITDEDAIALAAICFGEYDINYYQNQKEMLDDAINEGGLLAIRIDSNKRPLSITPNQVFEVLDYLRLKGYAIPYLGISVEQMVEAGWIKLTP